MEGSIFKIMVAILLITTLNFVNGECPSVTTCEDVETRYRTADGSCNNLENPEYGMSFTRQDRLAENTYDDGVSAFRTKATNGGDLPNVRAISTTINTDGNKTNNEFTLSVMQWSQITDHDLTFVLFHTEEDGSLIDCCNDGSDSSCMPIDLSGDPFYDSFGVTCQEFTRSTLETDFRDDCTSSIAEQANSLTHWFDGSNIYGSTEEVQHEVRSFENGELRTSPHNMLPINPDQDFAECEAEENDALCVLAGDFRVNEQPGLTAIHTLFMREHNRIAKRLRSYNPSWDDEQLFQETRRIVVAELQHITYTDWLPIIVGSENMVNYNLVVPTSGFTDDYDPTIFPNMFNEFSAACFRYGHTLVQGLISTFSKQGDLHLLQLRENFNSPHQIQNENLLDDIIRGLFMSNIQEYDNCITEDLTSHLFQAHGQEFGMDLMSFNLQRGRDHGIATYNTVRGICGLPVATTFNDLSGEINQDLIDRLASVYDDVNDIDLWAGGISETTLGDGLLGPTFSCVVSMQFRKLRLGDRFFYTLGGQPDTQFTEAQLDEIRHASWARIICDNSKIKRIQADAFRVEGPSNPEMKCNDLEEVDLTQWKET